MIEYGGIADDFTGATDLATNWRARGRRVAVLLGVGHDSGDFDGVDAAVIALKTRTIAVRDAVADSLAALEVLRGNGAERIYDKYCSTFDSTSEGNIGPVLDALADALGVSHAVVVPSFPDAGRTVYQRRLFVHDQLLEESPMRHHPLTPMRESDVVKLLTSQSERVVDWVDWATVQAGHESVRSVLASAAGPRHVVVDAVSNRDLRTIAKATEGDKLVSGGSGLALGLEPRESEGPETQVHEGFRAVLAGSASSATRAQVTHAAGHMPSMQLDLDALSGDLMGEVERLAQWCAMRWGEEKARPVLVYATASLSDVVRGAQAAALVERALACLAVRLTELGLRQLLVAGGETSGSVLGELGVKRLELGSRVAAGLSWASGSARRAGGVGMNLLLKSGNFGDTDLFTEAWGVLEV